MQKPINYTEFFTFHLYQPIAILEGGTSLKEVEKELMESNIFPLSYIKDKNNPVFKKTEEHFKKSGITQKIIIIILPFVYTKENNT
jgi:hypothetical protein